MFYASRWSLLAWSHSLSHESYCQQVAPGGWALFTLKDGNGCKRSDVVDSDSGLFAFDAPDGAYAKCAPTSTSAEPPTIFQDGNKLATCSGNQEGVECAWSVQAPETEPDCTNIPEDEHPEDLGHEDEGESHVDPPTDTCSGELVSLLAVDGDGNAFVDPFDGDYPINIIETGHLLHEGMPWKAVTFEICQTWNEESIDALYVDYDRPDTTCAATANVQTGTCLEYTAVCMESTHVAVVNVYSTDGTGDEMDPPECCKPKTVTTPPKVSYTFELHCTCPEAMA
jgi:hypothetical protein